MLVIANWKLNHNLTSASDWFDDFFDEYEESSRARVAIAPSFTEIPISSQIIEDEKSGLLLYSQDISAFTDGKYTGEVSAGQLVEYGVSGAIIGHSERREFQRETNEDVANKVQQALSVGITPVVAFSKIEQIKHLSDLVSLNNIHVAYEPLEAIGSGDPADPQVIEEVLTIVDQQFAPLSCIYGGSVSAESVSPLLEIDIVSGFLVGTACVDVQDFLELLGEIE